MGSLTWLVVLLAAALIPARSLAEVPAPAGVYLYIIWPNDGQVIKGAFSCRFGLRNMGVAPAGVRRPNTGHHHLLIDVETPPLDKPIPNDLNHIHLGGGQTEKRITLPPGEHTLQLIFADAQHMPHDPPVVSERIKVTVRSGARSGHRRSRRS